MKSGELPDRAALRALPSVDELLRSGGVARLVARAGRERVAEIARDELERRRGAILSGRTEASDERSLADAIEAELDADARRGSHLAVNATGVVLHTGLGRAPVHSEVAEAMARAARSYCTVELDRESGERNERDARVAELLQRLTGAEAAIAVNNNAGAVFLALQTFAGGREAIVSRGELVEIGGSFRVPDVMARAGVTLREVGTTNRTRLADYRAACGARTGLLMKVHASNFRIVGFTEDVEPAELAALGRELGVASAWDLGSGLVDPPGARPLDVLGREPRVRDALASGIELVLCSGDKLFGGPQAGLVLGQRERVRALRSNPIYRALRLDKVALAGLERTLELYLEGRADELPARRMLLATKGELEPVARRIASRIGALAGFEAKVVAERSQPGSGSAPDVYLDTWAVAVRHAERSASVLARALRLGEPPVMARIREGELVLDPRTLLAGDEARLVEAFERLG